MGDPDVNFAEFEKPDSLATYALVLFVRGLAFDLKFSLTYFATDGITATQVVPLFWQAICLLERTCNLWVIATVSDSDSDVTLDDNYKSNALMYADDLILLSETEKGLQNQIIKLNLFCKN